MSKIKCCSCDNFFEELLPINMKVGYKIVVNCKNCGFLNTVEYGGPILDEPLTRRELKEFSERISRDLSNKFTSLYLYFGLAVFLSFAFTIILFFTRNR